MKFVLILLLLFSLQCKQATKQQEMEENPFGRFERWLNRPISRDFPNQNDLDTIWGISLPERNWLIEAKARLACVREKTKVPDFAIQSSHDIAGATSYISGLALQHGCDHIRIDSFVAKIESLNNQKVDGGYQPAGK
jgi:hypothetical protein